MNLNYCTRVIFIMLFVVKVTFCYSQNTEVNSTDLDYTPKTRGYILEDLTILYRFLNCAGDLRLAISYNKDKLKSENYFYKGKVYTIDEIGREYFEKQPIEILHVSTDLYEGNLFLGTATLHYITGFGLGCLGDTYDILKIVGKESEKFKEKINTLNLRNVKIESVSSYSVKVEDRILEIEKEKNLDILLNQAEKFINRQDYVNAIKEYKAALKIAPDNIMIKNKIDEAKKKLYDLEESLNTKKYNDIVKQADSQFNKKELDQAKKLYEEALELKPQDEYVKKQINTIHNMGTGVDQVSSNNIGNDEQEKATNTSSENESNKDYKSQSEPYSVKESNSGQATIKGQDIYNQYMENARKIEENRINAIQNITTTTNMIFSGIMAEQAYNDRLSKATSINVNVLDPKSLINQYENKRKEIEKINQARYQEKIQQINAYLQQQVNSGNATSAQANLAGTIAMLSTSKRMAEEKAKAEEELEESLKEAMSEIKSEVIRSHNDAIDQYREASANALHKEEETYYFKMMKYHECCINSINQNFYYKNTNWINTNCNKPIMPRVTYNNVKKEVLYLEAAKRKLGLFSSSGYNFYKDAAFRFINASLAYNNKYAEAYYYRANLFGDIISKMIDAELALRIDPDNQLYISTHRNIKEDFKEAFFNALRRDDVDFIRKAAFENKLHYNLKSDNNETPILYAIKLDKSEALNLLILSEIDKEKTLTLNGKNYLMYAASRNSLKCIKLFENFGLDINIIDEDSGQALLYIAYFSKAKSTFDYLVSKRSNIDYTIGIIRKNHEPADYSGLLNQFLDYSIRKDDELMLEKLLSLDPSIISERNLDQIIKHDSKKALKYLIDNRIYTINNEEVFTNFLDQMISENANNCLAIFLDNKIILDLKFETGNLLHYLAKMNSDPSAFNTAIRNGLDINSKNTLGNTPLYEAVLNKSVSAANSLIAQGADVNIKNKRNWAPIHVAAWNDQPEVLEQLINSGAKVNMVGENGWTALHYAAKNGDLEACEILINNGANKSAKERSKRTPFKIALENQHTHTYKLLK